MSRKIGFIFICMILSIGQIYYYVQQEMSIYIWDYTGYWNRWHFYITNFDSIKDAIPSILDSIRSSSQYNNLPILFIWLAKYFPFNSRENYLVGIYIFIYLPVIFLALCIVKNIYKEKLTLLHECVFFLMLNFYPPFWMALLRGYIDMVGLIPILIVIIFCIRTNFCNNSIIINVRNILVIALLLWLPILLRRWYIFSIIALYICLPILNLILYKSVSIKNIVKVYLLFFIAGCIMSCLIILVQPVFFETASTNDYSFVYKAYYESVYLSYLSLYNKVGAVTLLIFLFGILGICKIKQMTSVKAFNIFCLVMLIISFNIFVYVQTIGLHHSLPYTLWIFFIFWFGWTLLVEKYGFIFNFISIIIWLGIFYITFNETVFREKPPLYEELDLVKTESIFPELKLPLYIDDDDLSQYLNLVNDLRGLITSGKQISIIGSNQAFSADLFRILSKNTLPIINSSQIDFRDEINMDLFSDYVVVTDPILIHRKGYQCIITIPGEELLSGNGIGKYYQRLDKTYLLDENIKAYIFKKNGDFQSADVSVYLDQFIDCHPLEWNKQIMKEIEKRILLE